MGTNAILELDPPQAGKGIRTQHLWIAGYEDRRVPGLVFTSEDARGTRPLVLLGHGAGGSKDELQMQRIARWLVRRNDCAVAIIDGPVHGERSSGDGQVGLVARQALAHRETYEGMAVDWQRTVDACGELPDVGNERVAYLGFSMGTVLGVPSVAAEPRVSCAVFAIGGILDPQAQNLLTEAAQRIERPVLMINQTEDEIFSRESAFRLYDALPGPKRVFFYPGGHTAVPREAMERVGEFLHAHLAGERDETGAPAGAW